MPYKVKKNDAYYTILKLVLVIVVVSLLQNVARLNSLVYNKYTNHYGQLETMYVDQHQTHSRRDVSGSGLRAIITGLEHSGSTKVGRILASAPCIMGAYETGYLLAPTPQDIDNVLPWFEWNSGSRGEMVRVTIPSAPEQPQVSALLWEVSSSPTKPSEEAKLRSTWPSPCM